MSDSFITQCPHCQTRFRVNSAQLGAASGAVRCGTCLKVFNAPQNMLGESTPAPILTAVVPPPVSPPSPTPAPAPKPAIEPAAPATAEAAPSLRGLHRLRPGKIATGPRPRLRRRHPRLAAGSPRGAALQ
ncbi:hypothetical protein D0N87_02760 [Pseudomonas sp. ATCC 13867]|nr:hypothetical protein D0N87_02760 [Pseudomonas sp. ATCC 13867]